MNLEVCWMECVCIWFCSKVKFFICVGVVLDLDPEKEGLGVVVVTHVYVLWEHIISITTEPLGGFLQTW